MKLEQFQKGARIRHRNALDVDLWITKVMGTGPTSITFNTLYLNTHYNGSLIFSEPETVTIDHRHLGNWKLVS